MSNVEITMVNDIGVIKANTSNLLADAESFAVSWASQ
jgi:hypothetical protein